MRIKTIVFLSLFAAAFSNLPRAAGFPDIQGWAPLEEPRFYGPDNLWDEINGGADIFLDYGFRELSVRELTKDETTVSVGIYDMGTALNAYGIFKTESPPESRPGKENEKNRLTFPPIGTRSVVIAPHQGLLLKDRYYVKVSAYTGKPGERLYTDLLKTIASVLDGEAKLPEELNLLPSEGKVLNSEMFSRESFLGLKELRNCVHARYGDGDAGEYRLFCLIPVGNETNESNWEILAAKWESLKKSGRKILVRDVPYQGKIGVIHTPRGIYGLVGVENEKTLFEKLTKLTK